MKVKNQYIQINIGKKTYKHENMILNEYLYKLFNMQMDVVHDPCIIDMCCIKLDTPIQNVDYDSEIAKSEFEILIGIKTATEKEFINFSERTENSIKINYIFGNSGSYAVYGGETTSDISRISDVFTNRRIMGIGFCSSSGDEQNIYTYLDTSSANLVINKNEEISIIRTDILQSNGVSDGIEYPLHLVNDTAKKNSRTVQTGEDTYTEYTTKAQLYSVGFGNKKGLMEQEYLIGDVLINRDDNSITLDLTRNKEIGYYPSDNLLLGFTPILDNSKYLIFKYRLYMINSNQTDYEYLDEYYTMNVPNEQFGNLTIKLKVERL